MPSLRLPWQHYAFAPFDDKVLLPLLLPEMQSVNSFETPTLSAQVHPCLKSLRCLLAKQEDSWGLTIHSKTERHDKIFMMMSHQIQQLKGYDAGQQSLHNLTHLYLKEQIWDQNYWENTCQKYEFESRNKASVVLFYNLIRKTWYSINFFQMSSASKCHRRLTCHVFNAQEH